MKIKFLDAAFINNVYYKKGEIAELNIDKCPSCAEVIGEKPKAKEPNKKEENSEKKEVSKSSKEKSEDEKANDDEAKKEYLEELLNKAFDKGILLEGTENKTVDEQIKELEELLKG